MPQLMKAAILNGIRSFDIQSVEKPIPKEGEILLKIDSCSICGSDLRIYNHGNDRVQYPAIIGHEIAGTVVESKSAHFKIGERLALGADVPSMLDVFSKNGLANLSDINYAIGYQFPGGFSEYCLLNKLTVDFGPITKIPNHVKSEVASLCEPLACCINGLELGFMAPGKTVLIFGAGPIGVMLAKAAYAFGAGACVLLDLDQNRVEQAKEMGIPDSYLLTDQILPELIEKFAQEKSGFDLVFTACPSPSAHEMAIDAVGKRGVVNLFGGLPKSARKIQLESNTLHYKEAYLTGSHGSTPVQHQLAMKMIANSQIDLEKLVSHRFALEDIDEAMSIVENRKGLKALIFPFGLEGKD